MNATAQERIWQLLWRVTVHEHHLAAADAAKPLWSGVGVAHMRAAREEAHRNGHTPWTVLFDVQLAWLAVETGEGDARPRANRAVEAASSLDHAFITNFAKAVAAMAAAAERMGNPGLAGRS